MVAALIIAMPDAPPRSLRALEGVVRPRGQARGLIEGGGEQTSRDP
jgi:hypothetical protein